MSIYEVGTKENPVIINDEESSLTNTLRVKQIIVIDDESTDSDSEFSKSIWQHKKTSIDNTVCHVYDSSEDEHTKKGTTVINISRVEDSGYAVFGTVSSSTTGVSTKEINLSVGQRTNADAVESNLRGVSRTFTAAFSQPSMYGRKRKAFMGNL